MNLALKLSRLVYWLLWPVFYLMLRNTQRTRVLLVYGTSALVVKTWFGNGKWELPGGGVQGGEALKMSAVRELYEELAITIDHRQLKPLGRIDYTHRGISTHLIRFGARLRKKPEVRKQWNEISHAQWIALSDLNESNTDRAALDHIDAWRAKA